MAGLAFQISPVACFTFLDTDGTVDALKVVLFDVASLSKIQYTWHNWCYSPKACNQFYIDFPLVHLYLLFKLELRLCGCMLLHTSQVAVPEPLRWIMGRTFLGAYHHVTVHLMSDLWMSNVITLSINLKCYHNHCMSSWVMAKNVFVRSRSLIYVNNFTRMGCGEWPWPLTT